VLRERLNQTGAELLGQAQFAGSGATACFANAVLIDPSFAQSGEPSWRREVSALHTAGLWLGVSALRAGGWSIKLVARDGMELRAALGKVRRILAATYPRLASNLRKL